MARALEQNPKSLPPKALRQWEAVYESAQARGLNKQGAAAQAWCAVKRKYKKSGKRWVLRKQPLSPAQQPPGCVKSRRRNPPKLEYAIVADEKSVGWWSRPARIVTREEAIRSCQSGVRDRCITLVGAKDLRDAQHLLDAIEATSIEITTPNGAILYSGPLLDLDSTTIRPGLRFVDAGRVLQLAVGPLLGSPSGGEVKLAGGKLRARTAAANNPRRRNPRGKPSSTEAREIEAVLNVIGFKYAGTGGNCEAYVKATGLPDREFLLVRHPDDSECEAPHFWDERVVLYLDAGPEEAEQGEGFSGVREFVHAVGDGTSSLINHVQRQLTKCSSSVASCVMAAVASRDLQDLQEVNSHRADLGMKPLASDAGFTAKEIHEMAQSIRKHGRMVNPSSARAAKRMMNPRNY